MMFLWILVVLGVVWFAARGGLALDGERKLFMAKESPLEILERRYAKGEISKDEYLEMKETLKHQ